jgi:hypothetical protein
MEVTPVNLQVDSRVSRGLRSGEVEQSQKTWYGLQETFDLSVTEIPHSVVAAV